MQPAGTRRPAPHGSGILALPLVLLLAACSGSSQAVSGHTDAGRHDATGSGIPAGSTPCTTPSQCDTHDACTTFTCLALSEESTAGYCVYTQIDSGSCAPKVDAGGDACTGPTCTTGCHIDGTAYAVGTVNPTNICQSCQPSMSATAWTTATDGTVCGDAAVCTKGTCGAGCEIAGVGYAPAAVNPGDSCQACNPAMSTSAWTTLSDGTTCGMGQVCISGACGAICTIGGTTYAYSAPNPVNACQSCQPAMSTSAWSNVVDGIACGAGEICGSGTCSAGCEIGGVFYSTEAVNPANACQVCTPLASTFAWSNASDGTSCGQGMICGDGSCGAGCEIGGIYYPAAMANPANACQICTPTMTTSAWSNVQDGTACNNGAMCTSGTCG